MSKYVFGFDFGTLSCRGVAISLDDGSLAATEECHYQHGVISGTMKHKPIPLPNEWFLQDPEDWVESMSIVSQRLLKDSGIRPEDVVGIGTDFTSCTLLPIKKNGEPLCLDERFRDNPNAWPKLWKHHGAQSYAERIERYAKAHTTWLKEYFGNSVSSEWVFPKMMQVAEEAPEIYREADYFIEAVDYIVLLMTGNLARNSGVLGVNAFWIEGRGYPDREFCKAIHPLMENVAETKLAGDFVKAGDAIGYLTAEMSGKLGLTTKTVVAAGHSDGAVAGCGAGVTESGSMMLVMGTSTCHQMMYHDFRSFDGVCSIAADGMIPGLYGYESGQPATGDLFGWFAENFVPARYVERAAQEGKSLLTYLGELAEKIKPGESGLVALDWFNGNRSILSDYNLSGAVIGLTLHTKTEEVFRALVEANIFGSKRILDNYEENGVHISTLYAVGGIALKSPWIMQMCADIFNQEVIVPQFNNVPARGAAACAAVAVGKAYGAPGCVDFEESSRRLIPKERLIYHPHDEMSKLYEQVYRYYRKLHDIFGMDDSFMRGLKRISDNP